MTALRVRPLEPGDASAWRALFDGYTRFYERVPSASLTDHTWSRLMAADSAIGGLVAVNDREDHSRVVGIANYVVHDSTSHPTPVCYLQDLFVDPDARGLGAGRLLIDTLITEMHQRGWARLYWNTKTDNVAARALYDTYCTESGFVRYVIDNRP